MKLYVSHFIFISPPFFYYIKKIILKKFVIIYYMVTLPLKKNIQK